ncbi:MAG: methyltransferase domain-containing protein [Gammaproteobacteria bacterium]|nr:methyltransferase domain-containing protein [Gammaproteobacteria bacterium]MDH5659560.1 methyltransferase domain-containing protein [Gammaproteobacteria bacterium]
MTIKKDQNFDNLSQRFRKNIYHTAKGKIRLNILWRDLSEQISQIEVGGLSILDAGAGQGNFALQLTKKKHKLTLCDLSEKMLDDAQLLFTENNVNDGVRFINSSVQTLSEHINEKFDVVLFHAVLEWLVEPEETLKELMKFIRPGGYLSLMFYSRTGLIYQNLTKGNFNHVLNNSLAGEGKTLTPTNPQDPNEVYSWISESGLKILTKSGVRVFYDGIHRDRRKQINEDDLFELEKKYSRIEPYCSLARYIHVLCQKPN